MVWGGGGRGAQNPHPERQLQGEGDKAGTDFRFYFSQYYHTIGNWRGEAGGQSFPVVVSLLARRVGSR